MLLLIRAHSEANSAGTGLLGRDLLPQGVAEWDLQLPEPPARPETGSMVRLVGSQEASFTEFAKDVISSYSS